MISKSDIEKLVDEKIRKDEKPGDRAGGSGHLSWVDYVVDRIDGPVRTEEGYRVDYKYTLIISTEFTYEPDNPPYQEPKSGSLIIKATDLNE